MLSNSLQHHKARQVNKLDMTGPERGSAPPNSIPGGKWKFATGLHQHMTGIAAATSPMWAVSNVEP